MITIKISAISFYSSSVFSRDSDIIHDEETTKQSTLDIGNNPSHDENKCSNNNDENDEKDENYTVSEDKSEIDDRASKQQQRISECSTENSKENCFRNSVKSTTSTQNTEDCTFSSVNQKNRYSSTKLHIEINSPNLFINDILMLASDIISVVIERLTNYSVTSGKVAVYNKKDHPTTDHSIKRYKERLRDEDSRL